MTTDFTYNNKTIDAGGPIKPAGKNQPLVPRTEVKLYADIETIPNPYVGMIITVLQDETNSNKMTDYKVLSLKADNLGVANSVVDQVQRYVDYLGASSSGGGTGTGLTPEQEAKLNSIDDKVDKIDGKGLSTEDFTTEEKTTLANLKTTIGDNSSGLVKDVVDLKTNGVSQDNINSAVENYLIENPIEVSDKNKISLDWWNPPTQPNTWANTTMKSEEFLSTFFDTYITNDSDTTTDYTFKKTSLGKEASRIYDIYEYIFTPNNYNRTIMISSIMHGIEIVGGFSVGRLLYYIINEPDVHELIRYIRDNVRIIFMPLLNPYGFDQTPRQFANYNGVNINSNFDDGGWNDYFEDSYNMKGVAPLSEPEARIISEQLKKYQYELDFWIDCHTGAGWDHDVWMYYIDEDEIFKPKVIRAGEWETQQYIIDKGCSESDLKNRIMDADTSHKLRYAYKNFGVSCSTPEYVPRRFGGDFNGSSDLKAYLRHLCGLLVSGLNTEDWNKEKIKGNGIKSKKNKENTETSNSTNILSNYIILNSPDGTEYKITVSNDGIISAKLAKIPLISAIGNISYSDGRETDSTSAVRTDYIKCVNNDTMSYSLNSKYKMVGRYYDSSKKFLGISGNTFVSGNGKFTLLNNTTYVRLVIKNIYETDFTSDNLIKEIALDGQKYTLTYGNPPESNNIILDKQNLNINVSDTYQLNATLNGTNINSTATWSADNDNVSVLNGLVTANLVGTSTITVSMENKNSATCLVNVTEKTEADTLCELGTITSADGLEKDGTTYIRTSFLPVTVTDKITISKTTSLYYLIRCYDENKRYIGVTLVQNYFKGTNDGNGWAISDGDWSGPLINSTVKYVRIVFTKQDGKDFTSSDIDGSKTITVNGSEYSITLNI